MKVHCLTMVYCNERVFKAGMAELDRTADLAGIDAQHWLLWQHYPLGGAETEAAAIAYVSAAATKPDEPDPFIDYAGLPGQVRAGNRILLDAGRNLGTHDGLNYMVAQLDLQDDDVVLCFDADEKPLREGWAQAMVEVLKADPTCGWLSLMSPPASEYMDSHGAADKEVAGYRLRVPGYSLINTVVGWSGRAIKAMGKFTEPHGFYGGFEGAMMPPTMAAGYWIGWLRDYWVAPLHDLHEPEYQLYKRHHVGFEQPTFPGSFADWCRSRGVK